MNLILIDDDFLVTTALKTILEADPELRVPAVGASGSDAVSLYDQLRPDILLMDIRMKDTDGLAAAQAILSKYPDAKILLLTTFSDDEYIVRALKIGAKGYLLKQDYSHLIPAIKAVYNGQTVFGTEITGRLPELLCGHRDPDLREFRLSEKELAIVKAVAAGQSNREIAESQYLSEGTVRNYLSAILAKLDLRDRTQLAVFYLTHS